MVNLIFKMDLGSGYVDVPPPRNWKDMKVQLIFDQKELQLQLQSINFEWVTKNAVSLNTYFLSGLTGGTGIFEGPGLQIYGQLPGTSPVLFFDGCINTADSAFNIQNDIITCPIKESGKIDWLHDVANGFTFEFLTSLASGVAGRITRSDYKQTPYAISSIPDYTQAMLLSISLFVVIKEAIDCITKIVSLITRAISQSLAWLQLVGTIVEIVLYLIYLVAVTTAAVRLIQDLVDNLIQKKKTKLCMREQDLFLKGCQYLGLGFVSSIYGVGTADRYNGRYVNATSMPIKIKIPKDDPSFQLFLRPPDETTEMKSYGYFEGTFKQFIDEMEMTYHAKAIIKNNTLYFEEKNYFNIVDAFTLPNEGPVGNTFLYPQPYGTNASEIPAVYTLKCQKDEQDLNTYNDYKGTFVIAQATPNIVRNRKNQLLHGAVNIELPFALARRKVGLTSMEIFLQKVIDAFGGFIGNIGTGINNINSKLASWLSNIVNNENVGLSNAQVGVVVGILTGNPLYIVASITMDSDGLPDIGSPSSPYFLNDRIGWMLLSSDFIGVRKRFIGVQHGDDWYIDPNNSQGTFMSAASVLINGAFTGTIAGVFGALNVTGNVVNGVVTVTGPAAGLGPDSGVITGTVVGQTGTFTAFVNGNVTGGFFTGIGAINLVGAVPVTTTTTQGWGSAQSLLNDFHYTNLIAENQWLTFKDKKFKFSLAHFNQINNSNILRTADGRFGKFEKIVWNLHNDIAEDVEYRIKHKYTNNYNLKITTDGG